eukprot:Phypoly_transcript_25765.p2 GENE.Phypoly_transcript_25765~~Phypoly_transcript_25765.p2  ORF type:complete len:124 (+),score=28.33 Phypoly_transcript_25765:44-373(+)
MATSLAAQQARQVRLLYRRAMCLAREHSIQRQVFIEEAEWIRESFRMYKDEKDPLLIADLIKSTELKVKAHMHPDPFVAPTAYRGFEYQRNTPTPEWWLVSGAHIPNQH